jgi:hypothetical protein
MTDLIPIQTLDEDRVRAAVREALRSGLDYDMLADFVAAVDWSGPIDPLPPIAGILGTLEELTTEYSEGDITRDEFIAQLLSLLPEDERAALRQAASAA